MVEIRDNSEEFLKKMEGRPKEESLLTKPLPIRRRLISMAGGKRRKFAPTIRGEDILTGGGSLYDSSSIDLGKSLPGPDELVAREEDQNRLREFLKNKDKFPLPKKDNGEKFKI